MSIILYQDGLIVQGRLAQNMDHALIQDRLVQMFGFNGKAKQVEVLYDLVVEKKDTILLAKTGFGKSILFRAPSILLGDGAVTIVLLPLLALQDEQEEKIKGKGGRPCVLNGDTNTPAMRETIRCGQYSHILTSPEIAVSQEFNKDILSDPEFSRRIALFAVDELHLIRHWGRSFRPDYMNIAIIRKRLPPNVPLLGVTATLNPRLLKEITASAGFNIDVSVIRTPLNRPEIFIQVQHMAHSSKSMRDLAFLAEPVRQNMSDSGLNNHETADHELIPKTIVFMDSILNVKIACRLLKGWISRLNYPSNVSSWVQPFFSTMSKHDKTCIASTFSRPSPECTKVRILVCTNAYGLGIDNPDVVRIIQYGVPETLEVLSQRAGRAMRSGGHQAYFLMLVNRKLAAYDTNSTIKSSSQPKKLKQQQATGLGPGLYDMITATKCLRTTLLEFFEAVDADPALRDNGNLCCSFCNPDGKLILKSSITETDRFSGIEAKSLEKKLKDWRRLRPRKY